MSTEDNDKGSRFTSAMGDLKGLLDKEGINVKSQEKLVKKAIADSEDNSDIDISDEIIPTLKIVEPDNADLHDRSNQEVDIPYIHNDISPVNLPTLSGTITVVDESEPGFVPIDDSPSTPLVVESSNTADLDDYISDFDDDQLEMDGFADSFKELEEKVASITEPGHLHKFKQSGSNNAHLEQLKSQLQEKLAQKIEIRIDELKSDLLDSIESEINELFKNLIKK